MGIMIIINRNKLQSVSQHTWGGIINFFKSLNPAIRHGEICPNGCFLNRREVIFAIAFFTNKWKQNRCQRMVT